MQPSQRVLVGTAIWLYWFSLYTYMPILPTYAKELGASYQLIGIILGSYGFTQMTLRLPLGILADRLNRRRIFLVIGAVFCLVSSLGMWLGRDVYSLLFFRFLSGVAATAWVVQTVLFASCYPPAEAGRAISVVTAVVNSGEMSALLLGGIVAQYFGQEQTFLFAAIISLPALAVNWAVREAATPREREPEPVKLLEIAGMARDWSLTLPSLLGFLVQVLTFGTVFGFVPLVAKNLGASYAEIGLLPTVFLLPGIAGSVLGATWLRRNLSDRAMVVAGIIVMAAVSSVTPWIDSLPVLFVTQGVAGFARGVIFPILMGLSIKSCTDNRQATAMGYFQTIYGMGMFLGPIVMGAISGWGGLAWGFWAAGLMGAAGAALATGLAKKRSSQATI